MAVELSISENLKKLLSTTYGSHVTIQALPGSNVGLGAKRSNFLDGLKRLSTEGETLACKVASASHGCSLTVSNVENFVFFSTGTLTVSLGEIAGFVSDLGRFAATW